MSLPAAPRITKRPGLRAHAARLASLATRSLRAKFKRQSNEGGDAHHHDDAIEAPHLALGREGEHRALLFLEQHGFRLVATNVRLPVGRTRRGAEVRAEIDIIAYDGATLCFVEVKTRRTDDFARPEANVDLRKQRQITRAARRYRRLLNITQDDYRYDVVSVLLPHPDAPAQIEHLPRFWTEAKFRKRRWGWREDL